MKRIAFFGLSANPPTSVHDSIVCELVERKFDQVIVSICGPRDDKASSKLVTREQHAALAVLGFPCMPDCVLLDLSDLTRGSLGVRTSTYSQLCRLRGLHSDADIWCVVGSDLTDGGREESEIGRTWINGKKLWDEFPFVVVPRPKHLAFDEVLPPRYILLSDRDATSSSEVRRRVSEGKSISDLVYPEVERYIREASLYKETNNETKTCL